LTDRMPKPLVPVADKPMIEYALDSCGRTASRSHHQCLAPQGPIDAYLSACNDLTIKISEETEPLETGGD